MVGALCFAVVLTPRLRSSSPNCFEALPELSVQESEEESGRWDLNPGPRGPEPRALAKLSHAPMSKIPTVNHLHPAR